MTPLFTSVVIFIQHILIHVYNVYTLALILCEGVTVMCVNVSEAV